MTTNEKQTLQSTLKSADTEEPIDIYFYRPIGYRWALLFQKMGISPNAVTIASVFLGVGAGICFYFTSLWINILGIFLLVWANSYDSADGQLARMTGKFSTFGRMLDGFAGDLWFASIYIAISLRMMPQWGSAWWAIWILASVAGIFHSKQASMADYYRNIHLFFLNGKSELTTSKDVKEEYKRQSWNKNFIQKIGSFFYASYTKGQESWSPNFQIMMGEVKTNYGDQIPQPFRDAFRAKSLPLMKYTNILSFNTRAIVLFIAVLTNLPWIYFVFELTVLNFLLVYMIRKHENICKVFTKEIKDRFY